jgi:excisionase family DNA binding protein
MTEEKLTYSVEEAAQKLGISRGLAYELARRGELPGAIRLGQKRIVVSRVQLDRILGGGGNGQ